MSTTFISLSHTNRYKKAQLWLTNQHDAFNPGHGSLNGIKINTIR